VLGLVWLLHADRRAGLRTLAWPYGRALAALALIVWFSWGVSSAKHFGAYDANRVLLDPERYLSQVRLELRPGSTLPDAPGPADRLYLLAADAERLVVWDPRGFDFARGGELRLLVVPRDEVRWFEARRPVGVQPGRQYL